jgi:hypothetical protein
MGGNGKGENGNKQRAKLEQGEELQREIGNDITLTPGRTAVVARIEEKNGQISSLSDMGCWHQPRIMRRQIGEHWPTFWE